MVKSCSAYGCQNRLIPGKSDLTFHAFPTRNIELRKKWIQAVRRMNFEPKSHDRICSDHFLPSDFRDDTSLLIKLLKEDAVPSVFKGFPTHLQTPAKKRRVLERVPAVATEVPAAATEVELPHDQSQLDTPPYPPLPELNIAEKQLQ